MEIYIFMLLETMALTPLSWDGNQTLFVFDVCDWLERRPYLVIFSCFVSNVSQDVCVTIDGLFIQLIMQELKATLIQNNNNLSINFSFIERLKSAH